MFTKSEADRIMRRAAEIEGRDDARSLSVDELKSIAEEAGFSRRAVERAITEARQSQHTLRPRDPVHRSGLVVTRLSASRTVPVELSSDHLMRAIRLFQPYRDGAAQIKLEEDRLTWRDRKGVAFTVYSAGGLTEIHIFVSKMMIRKKRWTEWVKAAADRLESILLLMDSQADPGSPGNAVAERGPRREEAR